MKVAAAIDEQNRDAVGSRPLPFLKGKHHPQRCRTLCCSDSIKYCTLRGLGTPREHEGCAKSSVERIRYFVFAYHCLDSFPRGIAGCATSCSAPSEDARDRKESEGGSDLYSSRNQAG